MPGRRAASAPFRPLEGSFSPTARLSAPFVCLPALGKPTDQQEQHGSVELTLFIVRPDRYGAFVTLQCLIEAREILQGAATVVEGFGPARSNGESAVMALQR